MGVLIVSGARGGRGRLITQVIVTSVPVLASINILDRALRLGRLLSSIRDVEVGLERLHEEGEIEPGQILRLVAEYNCIVTQGVPVLPRLWAWWHEDIEAQWNKSLRPHFTS